MSKRKRMHFARHCGRKRQFWSEEAAVEAASDLLASSEYVGSDRRRKRLGHYKCDYCDGWHIGHMKRPTPGPVPVEGEDQ